MHRLVGALCVVALVSCPRAAAAQVIPLADCVTEGSNPGLTQAFFGYRNLESAAVAIPVGPDNFFAPGTLDRGQPAAFEPGEFHRVFAVEFPSNSVVTWFVAGVQAPANATLPGCDLPLTWMGPWDAGATYDKNQIVLHLGSAWIALRRNTAQQEVVWDKDEIYNIEIENFPTLAVYREGTPLFFGVSPPQEGVIARTLTALASSEASATLVPDSVARLPAALGR